MPESHHEEKAIKMVTNLHIQGNTLAMESHVPAYAEFGETVRHFCLAGIWYMKKNNV